MGGVGRKKEKVGRIKCGVVV